MKIPDWHNLVISIIIAQLAGVIGSIFTVSSIPSWYATLQKPWFTPPNWLFGPVWITLYTLMGIALFLVWRKGLADRKSKTAVSLFGVQLVLNALWSVLFFGLQNPALAFGEIALLWMLIAATIWAFWRIDRRAGAILVPYIVWVTIASALNYYVWVLNP